MLRIRRADNPGTGKKLAGLDHLRALAITLVFLFHYRIAQHPGWIDTIGSFGWTGVDLFFVLSGYLIASPLFESIAANRGIAISAFYLKRFFRIIPAYMVVVGIYFCIPAFREREALSPLWRFLTFTQNFGLDLRTHGTFSHAWSLCIEEQFYLALPFTLLLLMSARWGKCGPYLIAGLFMLGFCFRLMSWYYHVLPLTGTDGFGIGWYKWIYYPTYNRLDGLLAGVSIAGGHVFYPRVRYFMTTYANILLAVGLAILTGAYFLCLDSFSFEASIFGFPMIAVGYGCIVIAAISPKCFLYRYSSRITRSIAGWSYSIYLTHKGLIHITQEYLSRHGLHKDSSAMFFLCVVVSLLGAVVLRNAVERPFLRLKERILRSSAPN